MDGNLSMGQVIAFLENEQRNDGPIRYDFLSKSQKKQLDRIRCRWDSINKRHLTLEIWQEVLDETCKPNVSKLIDNLDFFLVLYLEKSSKENGTKFIRHCVEHLSCLEILMQVHREYSYWKKRLM